VTGPRTGAPAADSVRAIVEFTSPGGRRYRIIKTTEVDAYDPPTKSSKPAARIKRKK
jgi:hypothetical protein